MASPEERHKYARRQGGSEDINKKSIQGKEREKEK
jgi:hypothetical protein